MDIQEPARESSRALISALNRLSDRSLDEAWKTSFDTEVAEEERVRHIGFKIAGIGCAISAEGFCELIVNPDISPLPNAPSALLGLCNIRGILVPVYSLQPSINSPHSSAVYVLLIGRSHHCIGLSIDGLPVTLDLNVQTAKVIDDVVPLRLDSVIMDCCEQKGVLWHRVNMNKLGDSLVNICCQESS